MTLIISDLLIRDILIGCACTIIMVIACFMLLKPGTIRRSMIALGLCAVGSAFVITCYMGTYDLVNTETNGYYSSGEDTLYFIKDSDGLLELTENNTTARIVYEKINASAFVFRYNNKLYTGTVKPKEITLTDGQITETFVKPK